MCENKKFRETKWLIWAGTCSVWSCRLVMRRKELSHCVYPHKKQLNLDCVGFACGCPLLVIFDKLWVKQINSYSNTIACSVSVAAPSLFGYTGECARSAVWFFFHAGMQRYRLRHLWIIHTNAPQWGCLFAWCNLYSTTNKRTSSNRHSFLFGLRLPWAEVRRT